MTTTRKTIRPSQAWRSVVRRLRPTAQMPAASVLERLSEFQRERLEKRLSEPIECVYHPCFRRSTMPDADLVEQLSGSGGDHAKAQNGPADADPPAVPSGVLSALDERRLFLQFNYCRYRVLRILAKHRGRRLTAKAARELLYWDDRAMEIRTEIVRANTSLVLAMARRSRNSGVELGELVSEGNLALLRCVDKFDAARGYKFSTYACRAILASFARICAKAARHRAQFPSPFDPALERSNYLESKREEIETDCVAELKHILFENAADLTPVERRVLAARFSLDQSTTRASRRRKTLDQVGALLGVSKERVRQIQNQAMDKIRSVLEQRLLAAS